MADVNVQCTSFQEGNLSRRRRCRAVGKALLVYDQMTGYRIDVKSLRSLVAREDAGKKVMASHKALEVRKSRVLNTK
jgi:hypothetical protein